LSAVRDCIGCDVIAGRIKPPGGVICQDTHWMATHALPSPEVPLRGLLVLQPKRHVEELSELTPQEAIALGPLLRRLSSAMQQALRPERIYACSLGEGIKHVHFLLLPRGETMPQNGADVLREVIDERLWTCSVSQAENAVEAIRVALGESVLEST